MKLRNKALILILFCSNLWAQKIDINTLYKKDFNNFVSLINKNDTLSLIFLGDVMLHSKQIEEAHRKYSEKNYDAKINDHNHFDFSSYFEDMSAEMKKSDYCIGNMEFSLGGAPFTGYPSFSAPDSYAWQMVDQGINVFLAANNHTYDRGASGASRTQSIYENMAGLDKIHFTGIGAEGIRPLLIRKGHIKIAIINLTYGSNHTGWTEGPQINMLSNKPEVHKAFLEAKNAHPDLIIAAPHWGVEYALHHSKRQAETAGWLAECGADIIIGTHPHVVQDTDTIATSEGRLVPVIYSLGNAVSNMSAINTQIGLMLSIKVVKFADGSSKLLEPVYDFTWCSLAGNLSDNYKVIKVKDYIGKKEMWKRGFEYDKMINTYNSVKKETNIDDTKH